MHGASRENQIQVCLFTFNFLHDKFSHQLIPHLLRRLHEGGYMLQPKGSKNAVLQCTADELHPLQQGIHLDKRSSFASIC